MAAIVRQKVREEELQVGNDGGMAIFTTKFLAALYVEDYLQWNCCTPTIQRCSESSYPCYIPSISGLCWDYCLVIRSIIDIKISGHESPYVPTARRKSSDV